jgi:hypothetical protein
MRGERMQAIFFMEGGDGCNSREGSKRVGQEKRENTETKLSRQR